MSFGVSVSTSLNRSLLQRLLRLPGGLVDRDMRRRVQKAAQRARRDAPGSMKDRIRPSISYGPQGPIGTISVNHPAALFVIYGTEPHQIRPVRAQALRFTVGGRVVFARLVNHPGTKPNDFLRPALRDAARN